MFTPTWKMYFTGALHRINDYCGKCNMKKQYRVMHWMTASKECSLNTKNGSYIYELSTVGTGYTRPVQDQAKPNPSMQLWFAHELLPIYWCGAIDNCSCKKKETVFLSVQLLVSLPCYSGRACIQLYLVNTNQQQPVMLVCLWDHTDQQLQINYPFLGLSFLFG